MNENIWIFAFRSLCDSSSRIHQEIRIYICGTRAIAKCNAKEMEYWCVDVIPN